MHESASVFGIVEFPTSYLYDVHLPAKEGIGRRDELQCGVITAVAVEVNDLIDVVNKIIEIDDRLSP